MKTRNSLLRSSAAGFTLVEVTIALAVVLIGLLAVLGMVANGLRSSRSATENCVPAMIAQDILNQIKATYTSYAAGQPLTTKPNPETLHYDIEGAPTNVPAYYQTVISYTTVPGLPASANPNITRVIIEVYWPTAAAPNFPNTNVFISQVTKLW